MLWPVELHRSCRHSSLPCQVVMPCQGPGDMLHCSCEGMLGPQPEGQEANCSIVSYLRSGPVAREMYIVETMGWGSGGQPGVSEQKGERGK